MALRPNSWPGELPQVEWLQLLRGAPLAPSVNLWSMPPGEHRHGHGT